MKRVCAWCGKELGESKGGPEGDVSHGICDDCLKKTLAGERTFWHQEIAQTILQQLLAHLTEELQLLEMDARYLRLRRHAMVCPLLTEPVPSVKELWPELPNGEGTVGLTASEIEQGRDSPPTCEPRES